MTKFSLILGAAWCFLAAGAHAQDVSASVDKTVGTLDDQFIYTLVTTASPDEDPVFPKIDGFEVHAAGTSTNMSYVNGSFSREMSYRFVLMPQKTGSATIPEISLKFDGAPKKTLPIKLTVNASGSDSQTAAGQEGRPPIFLERTIEHAAPYVGQPIVSVVRVFHRVHMLEASADSGQVSTVKRLSFEDENSYEKVLDGVKYRVTELRSVLIPLKAGTVVLPPYRLKAKVRVPDRQSQRPRGRDVFDRFFGDPFFNQGRVAVRSAATQETQLRVRSLPDEGRPAQFAGVVGDFQLSAELSAERLQVGETATLTVILSGRGPLDGIDQLPMPAWSGVKVYQDQAESGQSLDADLGIVARKTFKFALVPTQPGVLDLGQLEIPTFDPYKGAYRQLAADLGSITVSGAAALAGASSGSSLPRQQSVQLVDEDLMGIHRGGKLWDEHRWSLGSSVTLLGLVLSSLGLWLGLLLMQWRRGRRGDGANQRRAKAAKAYFVERKRWESAGAAVGIQTAAEAWKSYLGARWNRFGGALTPKDIEQQLESQGAPKDLIDEALEVSRMFDRSVYGGDVLADEQWQAVLVKLDRLVAGIERLS